MSLLNIVIPFVSSAENDRKDKNTVNNSQTDNRLSDAFNVVHKPQQHIPEFSNSCPEDQAFLPQGLPSNCRLGAFCPFEGLFLAFFLKRSMKGSLVLDHVNLFEPKAGILHSGRLKKLFDGAKSKVDDKLRTGLAIFLFS